VPAALPLSEPSATRAARRRRPEPILMNCSGKHAGMLATCVANGWPLERLPRPKHPLQVALAAAVADLAGEPIAATAWTAAARRCSRSR
jgi:L-asparaginase II